MRLGAAAWAAQRGRNVGRLDAGLRAMVDNGSLSIRRIAARLPSTTANATFTQNALRLAGKQSSRPANQPTTQLMGEDGWMIRISLAVDDSKAVAE